MDEIINFPYKEKMLVEPMLHLIEDTRIVKYCLKYLEDYNIQLDFDNHFSSFLDIKILNDKIVAIKNNHKKIAIFCDNEGLYYLYHGKRTTKFSYDHREVMKVICWCASTSSFYTNLRSL